MLFLIAINDITSCISSSLITQRLFADDYNISLRSSNPNRAHRLLQKCLNSISSWCTQNGFRFSAHKTHLVIFKSRNPSPHIPPLKLQNFEIPIHNSAKMLGLHFDQNLTWSSHIKILKAKCIRALSVIKYLSHPSKGCNRKILLQLYKSLIRSRLDYGAPIYNTASNSVLKLLNSIQSHSLRLVLGAFRTSPTLSLCAEAAEPPLPYRRLILTSNLMTSISQFPQLPSYNSIFQPKITHFSTHSNKNIRYKFEQTLHKPFISNPLLPIQPLSLPWTLTPPSIRLDLTQIPSPDKSSYVSHIERLIREYPQHKICLTDGSKSRNRTAYAFSIDAKIVTHRIRNSASISTAELMAIFSCLSQLAQLPPSTKYILLTDSLSSLHLITDPYSTNPLIQRIHLLLTTLNSLCTDIILIWIPGHVDFPPHDAVDAAAKQALSFPTITDKSRIPASDYRNLYRSLIFNSWKTFWQSQNGNKLFAIKKSPISWTTSHRTSRREEVALARLRIGHTRLTHLYIISPNLLSPPSCPHCQYDNLSVNHFFSCPYLQPLRSSCQVRSCLPQALENNSDTISKTLHYLRLAQFFPLL